MALFITKINTIGNNFLYRGYLRLLQLCPMPTRATSIPLPFFALKNNKFTVWMFFVTHSFKATKNFLFSFFFLFCVRFCSQGINFHNARGHYGEILPRQQSITARNFTGSNLCHIINILGWIFKVTCNILTHGVKTRWCFIFSCLFLPSHLTLINTQRRLW